jgi:hypothetical protein
MLHGKRSVSSDGFALARMAAQHPVTDVAGNEPFDRLAENPEESAWGPLETKWDA